MNEKESNKNAWILPTVMLLIPVALGLLALLTFILSLALEVPDHRGPVYSLCAILALVFFLMSLFPGIILIITGTILAVVMKLKAQIILGIIELLPCFGGMALVWYITFVAGAGV